MLNALTWIGDKIQGDDPFQCPNLKIFTTKIINFQIL